LSFATLPFFCDGKAGEKDLGSIGRLLPLEASAFVVLRCEKPASQNCRECQPTTDLSDLSDPSAQSDFFLKKLD